MIQFNDCQNTTFYIKKGPKILSLYLANVQNDNMLLWHVSNRHFQNLFSELKVFKNRIANNVYSVQNV